MCHPHPHSHSHSNSHDPQHQLAIRSIRRPIYVLALSLSLFLSPSHSLSRWCVISICFDIDWIYLWPQQVDRHQRHATTISRALYTILVFITAPCTIWTKSEYDLSDYPFSPIWDLYFKRVEFTTELVGAAISIGTVQISITRLCEQNILWQIYFRNYILDYIQRYCRYDCYDFRDFPVMFIKIAEFSASKGS